MRKSYVIQWKSTVNGRTGRGTKHFDFEEAESLAHELNQEYPEIHHEVGEAEMATRSGPQVGEQETIEQPETVSELPQVTDNPEYAVSS